MACRARAWPLVLALCAVSAVAAPLGAAGLDGQGRTQGAPRQQGPRGHMSPSDIQDQFDAYAILQAQDALRLTDDQFPQFVRRARELHTLRRRVRVERSRLVSGLNALLRDRNATDARLAAATQALDEHERASLARVQQAYAAIDEVLDARQRARFRVLEEQLERKKLDMLFRARQGQRR